MIGIDIQMPPSCTACPLSYWVQSGDYQGNLMCNGIEAILLEHGMHDCTGECLVNQLSPFRDPSCPLIEIEQRNNIIELRRKDKEK